MKHPKRICTLLALLAVALSTLALTNYPNGVASYGIPLPAGDYLTAGKYLFVNNTSSYSQDSYPSYGTGWDKPLRTIDYAIGKCTASKGDIIFVAPGHNENISSAAAITMDVAGVRLVGLGQGANRPKLTWTSQSGYIVVSATSCSLEGFQFDFASGATRSSYGVSIWQTKGTRIDNCDFLLCDDNWSSSVTATGKAGHAIYATGATNTQISNTKFRSGISNFGAGGARPANTSGVSSVFYVNVNAWNTEIGPNVYAQAFSAVTGQGLLQAGSRVSGFFVHNSEFRQENNSASCWALPTAGLASDVLVRDVITSYRSDDTGATSYTYWTVLKSPPRVLGQ